MKSRIVDWVQDHEEEFLDVCGEALRCRKMDMNKFCGFVLANQFPVNETVLYVLSHLSGQRISVLL